MKKIFFVCLICSLTFICTGCVKFGYNIEINDKDEISISETKGVTFEEFKSSSFRESLKSELASTIQQYKDKGFSVKEIGEGDYAGISLSKDKLTFKEAKESLPKGFMGDSSFEVNRGLIKKSYKIHLLYDLPEAVSIATSQYGDFRKSSNVLESVSDKIQEPIVSISTREIPSKNKVLVTKRYADGRSLVTTLDQEEYDEIMKSFLFPESVLTIKIPGKVTKNNADNVINDYEYQWYLTKDQQPVEIILEYEVNDFSRIAAIFSILVLLGAVFVLVQKNQKDDVVKGL